MYRLNLKQRKELERIQQHMLSDAQKQMHAFERKLKAEVKVLTKQLQKAGYSKPVIRSKISALLTRNKKLIKELTEKLVKNAEGYTDRLYKKLARYDVKSLTPLPSSKLKYLKATKGNVRAALAYAKDRAQIPLSKAVHKITAGQARQASRQVIRAIREAQSLHEASRELQVILKSKIATRLPEVVKKTLGKTKDLDRATGGLLKPDVRKLKRYLKKLKPDGKMQSAYLELVSDLQKGKAANAAINKWIFQKQRYQAERIFKNEQQGAFRRAQINSHIDKPWIIGYIWHLQRGHSRALHCVCETMDTYFLPKEKAEQWIFGAHPSCTCLFEPVVDKSAMMKVNITTSEEVWLATNK